MERFLPVDQFPDYAVSSHGRVENVRTGRDMRICRNGRGIPFVGMMLNGVQYKRSVPVLVAQAFLPAPIHESFDSVIHLDGVRENCHVENLMWRPHWFTVRYHRQFYVEGLRFVTPIYCPQTEEYFENSRHMATTYGLLERDIVEAHINGHMVWPTTFEVVLYE